MCACVAGVIQSLKGYYTKVVVAKAAVLAEGLCPVVTWLQKRAKVLRKDVRVQQFSNAMKGENKVDNAGNPKDLWSNADVKREVNTILKKAETSDHLINKEHLTMLAHLAVL